MLGGEAADSAEQGEEHEVPDTEGDAFLVTHLPFQADDEAEDRRQAKLNEEKQKVILRHGKPFKA